MFEPQDTRLPIECFPFKSMTGKISPYAQGSGDYFEFECKTFTQVRYIRVQLAFSLALTRKPDEGEQQDRTLRSM
jgi:hypothetical protein